ncbi:hypothetical protein B0H14DRAFT_3529745 [Mycena olivaceomarginata]|nr:hypothetical protein B0H14DRAFT_3529745 [Mycena olivaceomarginata]
MSHNAYRSTCPPPEGGGPACTGLPFPLLLVLYTVACWNAAPRHTRTPVLVLEHRAARVLVFPYAPLHLHRALLLADHDDGAKMRRADAYLPSLSR